MKIYDYTCQNCGHTAEKLVKDKDTEVKCPLCETLMNRMVSSPSFHLSKVDGFVGKVGVKDAVTRINRNTSKARRELL